jgi:hypothetical protein
MLTPVDDLRHGLTPGPHARESLFYGVLLPGEGLMVFLYTWVNAENAAGQMVVVVEGDDVRRAFSAADGIDVGAADFDDWEVAGLRVRHHDLLKAATLTFADDDVALELTFTGLHDAFSYLGNADGCPSFVADDRFEQSCRVTGTLVLDGREIAVDTTGHRDHSWGTRDWDTIQDWKWISGQAADGTAFNLMLMHARGETTTHGYVLRDGITSPIVQARAKARYDDRWGQTDVDLTITDAAGATTTVTAARYALFRFEAGERIVLQEAACSGTIDGVEAAVHFEGGWDKGYVALQAQRAVAT